MLAFDAFELFFSDQDKNKNVGQTESLKRVVGYFGWFPFCNDVD